MVKISRGMGGAVLGVLNALQVDTVFQSPAAACVRFCGCSFKQC